MQPPQRLHIAFAYDNGFVHAHPPLRRALDKLAQALTISGHEGVSQTPRFALSGDFNRRLTMFPARSPAARRD